jgi:dihydrofolate reductase
VIDLVAANRQDGGMRTLRYYVACTADRFIARADGSHDCFLQKGEHIADQIASYPETIPGHLREALGVRGENRFFDAVLMGRNTYETGTKLGITSPYPHLKQYLFARLHRAPDAAVELVTGEPLVFINRLKAEAGRAIWLCGGGALAAALAPAIDEVVLKVHPILLGTGIPIFARTIPFTALELVAVKPYASGVLLVHYRRR